MTTPERFDASAFLLLRRSNRHFAELLLVGTLIMLAVAYVGVLALPDRAIHQASGAIEPEHAGLWHGQFPHENVAAVVMVLSWVFERWRWTRLPIVVGGPVLSDAAAVGCALSEGMSGAVKSLGIDPTFTDRTDVWRLAVDAIGRHPMLGYGFLGFWPTPDLFDSGGESWAVQAFNGHNSWIDVTPTTGAPALLLAFVWLAALPLRDISSAERSGNDPVLTRLSTRIRRSSPLGDAHASRVSAATRSPGPVPPTRGTVAPRLTARARDVQRAPWPNISRFSTAPSPA